MIEVSNRQPMAVTEAQAASTSLLWGGQAPERSAQARLVGKQSFAFELDDDLTKIVLLQAGSGTLEVEVRFGRDHLLQEDHYSIPIEREPRITRGEFGVTVQVTRRVLPWFGWLRWSITYRF